MRIPAFSRQSEPTTDDERPTVAATGTTPVRGRTEDPLPPPPPPAVSDSSVARPSEATTTEFPAQPTDDRAAANRAARADLAKIRHDEPTDELKPGLKTEAPVVAGPKPRASLLATISLILAVGGALLVLSGPLTGYGIGVAGLALVLSLAGIRATRRRHVAGKTDALIALLISLAAIAVGVLALMGDLSWAGTDVQPVENLRNWLDTQFGNRF